MIPLAVAEDSFLKSNDKGELIGGPFEDSHWFDKDQNDSSFLLGQSFNLDDNNGFEAFCNQFDIVGGSGQVCEGISPCKCQG